MTLSIEVPKMDATKILKELHRCNIFTGYGIYTRHPVKIVALSDVQGFDFSSSCLMVDIGEHPTISFEGIGVFSVHGRK